jgi:uroporphyrinogen III methyltransferase / synthase
LKSLSGKKIIITRARSQAGELVAELERLGASVIEFPTIKTVALDSYQKLDYSLERIDAALGKGLVHYEWTIFTSANAVRFFIGRLLATGRPITSFTGSKIAAVGPGTAKKLKDAGVRVDMIPQDNKAEGLIQAFSLLAIKGRRILLPRALNARDLLPEALMQMGAIVYVAPCYQTVADETGVANVKTALETGVDIITFTSSSTVQNFLGLLRDIDLPASLRNVKLVYIGPIAAGTARRLGLPVAAVAEPHTVQGLVKAIQEAVGSSRA